MAAADPLRELSPPVGYDAPWALLGLALVALVVVWHLGVWWWTRPARDRGAPARSGPARRWRRARLRRRVLRALDALDAERSVGRTTDRESHLALSALVRGLAEDLGDLPARSLALDDLALATEAATERDQRRSRPLAATVAAVALTYPPGFAPDGAPATDRAAADERWARALAAAREAVAAWR